MNEIERAISILELMAIDLTGTLGGLSETNPLCDVVKQRIEAIDAAQDALREKSGRENRKTNADRIRSMSDEELHKFLLDFEAGNIDYAKTFCDLCCKDAALEQKSTDCDGCLLWWLKNDATLPQGIDSPSLFSSFFKPRRNTTARN